MEQSCRDVGKEGHTVTNTSKSVQPMGEEAGMEPMEHWVYTGHGDWEAQEAEPHRVEDTEESTKVQWDQPWVH